VGTSGAIRSFLCDALKYAIEQEIIGNNSDGWGNPMKVVTVPKGLPPKDKQPYTAAEMAAMLRVVTDPITRTVILVAAMTGLRKSEIMGLCWEDIDEKKSILKVRRSVYYGRAPRLQADGPVEALRYTVGPTKTKGSKAEVPISPRVLAALLALKPKPAAAGWIFRKKGPLDIANLVSYHIAPKLAEAGIQWRGYHAFRHGVATLLNERDVKAKTAQGILRHSNVTTTLQVYTHADSKAARRAVEELDAVLAEAEAKIA
jgi:integrase